MGGLQISGFSINRTWKLTIGERELVSEGESPLDLKFSIQKTNRREPNTAEINIFNWPSDQRTFVEGDSLTLQIGYEQDRTNNIIYRGKIDQVFDERQGPDLVTRIVSEDTGASYDNPTVAYSFPEGSRVVTVIKKLLDDMEVGEGNLSDLEANFLRRQRPITFETGFSARGKAWRVLNNLIRSAGYRWSIQDGNLNITASGVRNSLSRSRHPVISPETGLIGSPTVDVSASSRSRAARGKKTVIATCLPRFGYYIGARVKLASELVDVEEFEITKLRYEGETFSDLWEVELEMEAIND